MTTGSIDGAFRGALAGAIAGAAGGYANFGSVAGLGDATARIGVSALGGCAAGKASGSSCSKGAKIAAIAQALTMGAEAIYKSVSSKYNTTGKPHLLQEGRNDVGKQLSDTDLAKVKSGSMKAPLSSDQSTLMKTVGKGPYMDAFGEFHDGLHDYSFIPDDQFSLVATMPASYALTAVAAMRPYSHYYYLDLLNERRHR